MKGSKLESIITEDAIDLLSDRLATPLQIQHYIALAFEEAFRVGVKPVSQDVIDSVIARDINDLEPRLTRYGYSVKTLAGVLHVRQNVVKSFLQGQLPPGQTQEIQNEMLALGIPL